MKPLLDINLETTRQQKYGTCLCAVLILLAHPPQASGSERFFAERFLLCTTFSGMPVHIQLPADRLARRDENNVSPALNDIFGDDILQQNVAKVRSVARRIPLEARFGYLSDQVLPNASRSKVRLALNFTPGNFAPPVAESVGTTPPTSGRRVNIGGEVVSPAYDLIDIAQELDSLEKLHERVEGVSAIDRQSEQNRLALLAVIDLQRGDIESARQLIHALLATDDQAIDMGRVNQSAFLFALQRVIDFPQLHAQLGDDMLRMLKLIRRSQLKDVKSRHLKAVVNQIRVPSERPSSSASHQAPKTEWASKQWTPVDRFNAETRGTGINPSLWRIDGSAAENVASHGHDLLYFAVPLQQNVQVECEVTPFSGRDVELQVAGLWYAPSYTLDKFSKGNIRGARKYQPLPAKMSKVREWLRYQTSVRDGGVTTFFNGHPVETSEVPEHHDPWVAIHSERLYEGIARNVHFGGKPVVPEKLELATDPKQTGWCTYYKSSIGGTGAQWQPSPDPKLVRLIGSRRIDCEGTYHEEAIHYHRPMLEDGAVDIDFFYRKNEMLVHPAIDRLCFLLKPDGVKIHWLTDGAFDRTELAPDNEFREPKNRRGPAKLPLKNGEWNKARVQLTDDTVALTLNDVQIYERELEPTNQRHFGLFHYADQSEARVRSIIYQGDWRRELPPVEQQELADPQQLEMEAALAKLPQTLEHDFTNGLPAKQFTVFGTGWEKHVSVDADGVHVTRPGADNDAYHDYMIVPQCVCHGDFDITARFEDFQPDFKPGGIGSCSIRIVLDDENATWFTWFRRTNPEKNSDKDVVEVMMVHTREGRSSTEFRNGGSAESDAGVLRVARRGETMYFMLAEHDSPFFRVLAELPCSRAPTLAAGIRLLTSAHGPGETNVTWKNIRIRAEQISGLAVDESDDYTIAELDEQRSQMQSLRDLDFSDMQAVTQLFSITPSPDLFVPQQNGLRVTAPGTKNWSSSRMLGRLPITGDFDAELDLEVLKLKRSAARRESTVYLNAEFDGPGQPEIQCKCSIDPDGIRTVEGQLRIRRKNGSFDYRELHTRLAETITSLRIARRGNVAYLLFRRDIGSPWELLGQILAGPGKLHRNGLQIHVHTGGKGKETQVLLKRLKVDAVKQPAANPFGKIFEGIFE